ncbi:hypothetical protein GCM10010266_67340 [Streptomyces griseomycini]|nr:hypothetical protein GCM10010266_67340 [Streptomyces griseomycini]
MGAAGRFPCPRRPPPGGRTGAAGTTRGNDSHHPSGTGRSTITLTVVSPVSKPVGTIPEASQALSAGAAGR